MTASAQVFSGRFVDGSIALTLLRFALPLLLTNFLPALSGTWAAIRVGQVLGANALTAVATANVTLLIFGLTMWLLRVPFAEWLQPALGAAMEIDEAPVDEVLVLD